MLQRLCLVAAAAFLLTSISPLWRAGNCTAELDDGDLVIEGDDLDNCVDVAETSPGSGEFVVTGLNGTLDTSFG